jgi:hypothetical protein
MQQFLNNPAVVIAIIALIGAITNWINSLIRNNDITNLHKLAAKHEEQLNGGFETRTIKAVEPVINQAVKRVESQISTTNIPKVQ